MKTFNRMIAEAKGRYRPEEGFKPPLVFKEEKVIISVEPGGYPNMKLKLQQRLKAEGFKAYSLEGVEINLFECGKLKWNEE